MFWASQRETTKPQDLAYCLLGIFALNMPLIYGEGNQAFTRLQEDITKTPDDHSIFAWENNALMMTMYCSKATVQSCAAQWSDRPQSSLTLETSCLIGNNKQAIPTQRPTMAYVSMCHYTDFSQQRTDTTLSGRIDMSL
jgi:hypothetical protein